MCQHALVYIAIKLKEYLKKIKKDAENKTNFVLYYPNTYEAINEDVLTSIFTKFKKKYKLSPDFCLHSLRHFHVTELAECNTSSHHIAKLVGHTNSKITEEIYTHLRDRAFLREVEKLNYDNIIPDYYF
ncbi:MAG: tyrosine-type recombinase/integrase [Elusimicrobiota bacterium]|nr:tyrosine-type recombinase/integrase [Elusimicrobiota bacterium]